jgi:F0F1-type ATP synthase membrane subunit b/b'
MILHLLIIQIVTFVILLLVLRQIFYKQLSESLLRLQTLHKLNLARENELKAKIQSAEEEKEQKLAAAREKAENIINEAVLAAAKLTSDMEAGAEAKIASAMAHNQLELERTQRELASLRRRDTLELAVKVVSAAFSARGIDAVNAALVDEAIDELAGLEDAMFTACAKDISVASALPLDAARQERIIGILRQKTGGPVELAFHEASDAVAGIAINAGTLTIDGTLRNKLGRVFEHLQNRNEQRP